MGRSINVWEMFIRQSAPAANLRLNLRRAAGIGGGTTLGPAAAARSTASTRYAAATRSATTVSHHHVAVGREPQLSFRHDRLARFQTFIDHHVLIDAQARRDVSHLNGAVRL